MAEVADLFVRLRAETGQFTRGMTQAGQTGESFTQRMGGLGGMLTKVGKATTMVGLGFVAYGVKAAGDFQQQMNLLVTACGESSAKLKMVSDGVLSLARETGTSTSQLAEGMYQVEKAGYRAGDGLKVLRAAAQGAREEGADLKDVTNAMTSVMASYHLKATDSVRVMNAIKTSAGEGKMTMQEFAGSLSTVIPIASANKVSFAEVGGAIATLSQHGTSAREATQELASTIKNLAAPNNVAVQEMQRLGLSSTDVSTKLGKRGLTGTLDLLSQTVLGKMGKSGTVLLDSFNKTKQAAADADQMIKSMPPSLQKLATSYSKGSISLGDWRKELKALPPEQANLLSQYATLQNKTNGFSAELKRGGPSAQTYTEAIKKLTGGAIGLNTTLQLTGENTEGFKDRVDKVGESFTDAGKDVEGWKITQQSFNVQMGRLKETVTTAAIVVGTKLIPIIVSTINWFEKHKTATKALAIMIGVILTGSVLKFIGSALTPFVKAIGGIGTAIGKVPWGRVASGASGAFDTARLRAMYAWDGIKSGAASAGRAVANFGRSVGTATANAGRAAWSGMVTGLKSVGLAMKTAAIASLDFAKSMLVSAAAALRSAAATAWQKIQLVATTVATKVATAAQWALDAAMNANPITLIVIALIALVAAIIWVATKTTWFQMIWSATWGAIKTATVAVLNALKAAFHVAMDAIKAVVSLALAATLGTFRNALNGARAVVTGTLGVIKSLWSGTMNGIRSVASSVWSGIRSTITGAINGAKSAVSSAVGGIGKLLSSIKSIATNALSGAGQWLLDAGKRVVSGFVNGIKSAFGSVKSALGGLTDMLPSWKGPPARDRVLLHGAGQMIIQGLVAGMGSGFASVQRTARNVGKVTVAAFSTELGIQSPSTKFKQLGAYVMHGLISGLTGSTARVRAATERIARDLYTSFGSHHKDLQRVINKDNALMMRLAHNRDTVASRLKDAQKRLSDLQKDWTKERDSVAQGIMQGASVITAAPEGRGVNSFDVVDQMRQKVAQAQQFAANLRALQKKGLSSDMVQQLATAGVDQAGATVQALAAGTKGQIQEMNKLQSSLKGAANSTGAAVADSMYGAGIKSAQGLVKGLQSQEAAIEKQMMRIALAMQKAIKHALGIKSPSRVFESIGTWIPKGLAKGVDSGAVHAVNSARSLAGAVTGAAVVGATPGLALAGRGGGGATSTVIHNHYEIKVSGSVATIDGIAREVEESFLRRGGRNSVTYPGYRGR
ncbi:phage tail tape measure protein [Streptomyces sp. NPDC059994]|uniref:phage tail tape measure protein n=1 Tax=Streptomyces sp. NPDC059994 TaxID=3347029 RepID=UPI0036BC7C8B